MNVNWDAVGAIGQWFGVVTAIVAVVVVLKHEYWRRPELEVSFKSERDVKSQENTVGVASMRLSRWLRVQVMNKPGRRAAKNCRAYLTGIQRVLPDSVSDDFPNDVRPLQWMHDPLDEFGARDLLPGVAHWVDVVGTVEGHRELKLRVYPSYDRIMPGEYIVTILVSAEEADPVEISVRITWDGTWDSLHGRAVGSA